MNQVDENIIEFLKIGRYTFISERKWSNSSDSFIIAAVNSIWT